MPQTTSAFPSTNQALLLLDTLGERTKEHIISWASYSMCGGRGPPACCLAGAGCGCNAQSVVHGCALLHHWLLND